ncbi:MAG: hypothetical protein ACE5FD_15565 [Anaerolineae bacterium]
MTASSGHLDFDPYSFNAVSLFIIGLLSVIYLLRLQKKTAASWFLTAGLLGFTIGMAAMFFSTIILWGGVLVPLTDACASALATITRRKSTPVKPVLPEFLPSASA